MRVHHTLGLAVFVGFVALGFYGVRGPTQGSATPVGMRHGALRMERSPSSFTSVVDAIAKIRRDVENPKVFNAATAVSYIDALTESAYALNSSDFIPGSDEETRSFLEQADRLIQSLFETRLMLQLRLRDFVASGEVGDRKESLSTVDAFRRAILYLRYAEDYAIEWRHRLKPFQLSKTFFGGAGALSLALGGARPLSAPQDFLPGDVILVRGASFLSASIARIGDVVTNMSHLAIVAIDESGELKVVESLLEKGVIGYSLQRYLTMESLPRAALYRLRDPEVAMRAGREAWSLYRESRRKPIDFDIQMEVDEHSKVYCAEAIAMAYARASEGQLKIPMFRTGFARASKTDFFKGIGMTQLSSFAPADIDVDPRFQLIAEHRDLNLLAQSRRFDVVLSKLFDRFENGFTYKTDARDSIEAVFGKVLRAFGMLRSKVPRGISMTALTTLVKHKNLVNGLVEQLQAFEEESIRKTSRPMAYRELEEGFETICNSDCVERKFNEQK